MKKKLLKILLLCSIVSLLSLNAEDLKNSNENNISLRIEKLNKQINIDEIDTFKLRMEYQEIFSYMNNLTLKENMSEIVSLYIRLAQGISGIKLRNMGALIKREILEDTFIKEIKIMLDSNILTQKLQIELLLSLEKELLLTKKPLLIAINNAPKNLVSIAKNNLLKNNLTEKELELGIYMYDYSYRIMKKYIPLQLDAIESGSFVRLNKSLKKLEQQYMQRNKNTQITMKENLQIKAGILAYITMDSNLKKTYELYMSQILRNKKLLDKI